MSMVHLSGAVDFLLLLKEWSVLFLTADCAEATARADVPTVPREFSVFCFFQTVSWTVV